MASLRCAINRVNYLITTRCSGRTGSWIRSQSASIDGARERLQASEVLDRVEVRAGPTVADEAETVEQ